MRRKERAISDIGEITAILDRCVIMRLALCDGDQPYIVPLNFGYEMNDAQLQIYFHCAHQGRKIDLLTKNNNVCFEADRLIEFDPGPRPCSSSVKYESVIGSGEIQVLTDNKSKKNGLDLIMHQCQFTGPLEYAPAMLDKTTVLRIDVAEISGKANI